MQKIFVEDGCKFFTLYGSSINGHCDLIIIASNALENISNCKTDVEQEGADARHDITLSPKVHIVIVGIGVVFSVILFLFSFLV